MKKPKGIETLHSNGNRCSRLWKMTHVIDTVMTIVSQWSKRITPPRAAPNEFSEESMNQAAGMTSINSRIAARTQAGNPAISPARKSRQSH
jgi:hypothetical protein